MKYCEGLEFRFWGFSQPLMESCHEGYQSEDGIVFKLPRHAEGTPEIHFFPFCFGVSLLILLKLNIRRKGTLIVQGLLEHLVFVQVSPSTSSMCQLHLCPKP